MKGDRKTEIASIIENEKKKYLPYLYKEEKINEQKEKIEYEMKHKKSQVEKIMEKYKTKGGISTSIRMPVDSNSIYLSEKVPFCEDGTKRIINKSPNSSPLPSPSSSSPTPLASSFSKKKIYNIKEKTFPDVLN